MTSTTRRWLFLGLAIIIAFYVLTVFVSSPSNAAERTTERVGRGLVVTTVEARGICDQYPGGVLRGWVLTHTQKSMTGVTQYKFGPWSGSFCSNGSRLWSVNWGGEPGGWANWAITWRWDSAATRLVDSDNTGTVRHRKWRSHFYTATPGVSRNDYPWLYIRISASGSIGMDHGCGC